MKTSEFSLGPFDQTQEVFHLRVFGLGYTVAQKRNLGVRKTRSLIKLHNLVKKIVVRVNLRETSEVFNSEFSV